jgi:uncharacterized membrane protein required for colicin V production
MIYILLKNLLGYLLAAFVASRYVAQVSERPKID